MNSVSSRGFAVGAFARDISNIVSILQYLLDLLEACFNPVKLCIETLFEKEPSRWSHLSLPALRSKLPHDMLQALT